MGDCCNNDIPVFGNIIPFWGFTEFTPMLPSLYWNTYSQEQRIHALCEQAHKIICYADYLGVNLGQAQEDIETLENEFEQFKESGFLDYYEAQISQWVQDNMQLIMSQACKMVFFGLTPDGHFCAYVPDSWNDIVFDTGAVYGRSDYGRLILKMHTDGQNTIDNTYSYTLAQNLTDSEQFVRDLETATKRSDAAYDTLFTNLTEEVIINGSE